MPTQALCGRNASSSDIYMMELALQKILEATVGSEPMMHALASAAYQSFLRAYAAHSKAEKRVRAAPLSTPESGWHNTSNLGVLAR